MDESLSETTCHRKPQDAAGSPSQPQSLTPKSAINDTLEELLLPPVLHLQPQQGQVCLSSVPGASETSPFPGWGGCWEQMSITRGLCLGGNVQLQGEKLQLCTAARVHVPLPRRRPGLCRGWWPWPLVTLAAGGNPLPMPPSAPCQAAERTPRWGPARVEHVVAVRWSHAPRSTTPPAHPSGRPAQCAGVQPLSKSGEEGEAGAQLLVSRRVTNCMPPRI